MNCGLKASRRISTADGNEHVPPLAQIARKENRPRPCPDSENNRLPSTKVFLLPLHAEVVARRSDGLGMPGT